MCLNVHRGISVVVVTQGDGDGALIDSDNLVDGDRRPHRRRRHDVRKEGNEARGRGPVRD